MVSVQSVLSSMILGGVLVLITSSAGPWETKGDSNSEPGNTVVVEKVDGKCCKHHKAKPPKTGCPEPPCVPKAQKGTLNCAAGDHAGTYEKGSCTEDGDEDDSCTLQKNVKRATPYFKCVGEKDCPLDTGGMGKTCGFEDEPDSYNTPFIKTNVCSDTCGPP